MPRGRPSRRAAIFGTQGKQLYSSQLSNWRLPLRRSRGRHPARRSAHAIVVVVARQIVARLHRRRAGPEMDHPVLRHRPPPAPSPGCTAGWRRPGSPWGWPPCSLYRGRRSAGCGDRRADLLRRVFALQPGRRVARRDAGEGGPQRGRFRPGPRPGSGPNAPRRHSRRRDRPRRGRRRRAAPPADAGSRARGCGSSSGRASSRAGSCPLLRRPPHASPRRRRRRPPRFRRGRCGWPPRACSRTGLSPPTGP